MNITVGLLMIALFSVSSCGDNSPHLGDTLSDFSLKDVEGKRHSLNDYLGGKVMLFTLGHG